MSGDRVAIGGDLIQSSPGMCRSLCFLMFWIRSLCTLERVPSPTQRSAVYLGPSNISTSCSSCDWVQPDTLLRLRSVPVAVHVATIPGPSGLLSLVCSSTFSGDVGCRLPAMTRLRSSTPRTLSCLVLHSVLLVSLVESTMCSFSGGASP